MRGLKPRESPQPSPTDAGLAASTGQRPRGELSGSRLPASLFRLPSEFSFSLELPLNLFSHLLGQRGSQRLFSPVSLWVSDRQTLGGVPRAAGDSLPSEVSGLAGLTQPSSFGRRLE